MNNQIIVKVQTEKYLNIEDIKVFQGDLKLIDSTNLNKLKQSLITNGIDLCFHVWVDPKGINQIIDGTHRFYALSSLKTDGYTIPPLPVVFIIAKNKREAAQIILIANSRYAKMTQESISNFMIEMDLQIPDIQYLDIPELEMSFFDLKENFDSGDVGRPESNEKSSPSNDSSSEREPSEGRSIYKDEIKSDPKDDIVPEKIIRKAKLGDLFILGEHRLLCGDSSNKENVDRLINGNIMNLVFTSPPYNGNTHLDYGKEGGGNKKLYKNDSDNKTSQEYVDFCHKVLALCFEYCNGFIFWNVNYNAKSRFEFIKSIFPWIEKLHETIVWKKSGMPITSGLTRSFEFIFCFKNGERKHLGELNDSNYNLWDISNTNSQDRENHRACFPVGLPTKGIELGSMLYDNIYEPFGGSGTTLIACEKTHRKCFAMELDPEYCDLIITRWQKYSEKKAIREDGISYDKIEQIKE